MNFKNKFHIFKINRNRFLRSEYNKLYVCKYLLVHSNPDIWYRKYTLLQHPINPGSLGDWEMVKCESTGRYLRLSETVYDSVKIALVALCCSHTQITSDLLLISFGHFKHYDTKSSFIQVLHNNKHRVNYSFVKNYYYVIQRPLRSQIASLLFN